MTTPVPIETLTWTTSPFSEGGRQVEIAALPDGGRAMRDSTHPDGPVLWFNAAEWEAFVLGVRNGELR